MKRKNYSEEQIISILKEHEAGASVRTWRAVTAWPRTRSTAGSRSTAAWKSL